MFWKWALSKNPGESPLASTMGLKAGPPTGGDNPGNDRISAKRVEEMDMKQQTVHKTFKYKLKPTPKQEWALDRTLMLCRHVYNAALEERREAWQKRGVCVTYYQQKAELPGIKAELPEYAEV